ncbi:MAG: carboxypeptidase regulatory-like domain-containing protein [Planctomycetes bacterium]|nr:carboxypeptidase regulatory-like domain-containing protein [Planctomycetota bacterium]
MQSRFAILLIFIILCLGRGVLASPQPADSRPVRTFTGKIMNPSSRPVAGAKVTIGSEAQPNISTALSDNNGIFSIGADAEAELRADVYDLRVDAAGFAPSFLSDIPRTANMAVDLGWIFMHPACEIHGKIISSTGVPVPNANIWMIPDKTVYRNYRKRESFSRQAQCKTGADGAFHIQQFGPGSYTFMIAAHGFETIQCAGNEIERTEANEFDITMKPAASATGIVEDTFGVPIAGAEVGEFPNTIFTDEKGRFVLDGVPRRRASIRIYKDGYYQPYQSSDLGTSNNFVRADVTHYILAQAPTVRIEAKNSAGENQDIAYIYLWRDVGSGDFWSEVEKKDIHYLDHRAVEFHPPVDDHWFSPLAFRVAVLAADGSFGTAKLYPEEEPVPKPKKISSPMIVTITLEAARAISGTVVTPDGKPVAGAFVTAAAGDSYNHMYLRGTLTNAIGVFTFNDIGGGAALHAYSRDGYLGSAKLLQESGQNTIDIKAASARKLILRCPENANSTDPPVLCFATCAGDASSVEPSRVLLCASPWSATFSNTNIPRGSFDVLQLGGISDRSVRSFAWEDAPWSSAGQSLISFSDGQIIDITREQLRPRQVYRGTLTFGAEPAAGWKVHDTEFGRDRRLNCAPTDLRGKYRLESREDGIYNLHFQGLGSADRAIRLPPEKINDLNIHIGRGGVSGKIVDERNSPVRAEIRVLRSPRASNRAWEYLHELTTRADGAFEFDDLMEGHYELTFVDLTKQHASVLTGHPLDIADGSRIDNLTIEMKRASALHIITKGTSEENLYVKIEFKEKNGERVAWSFETEPFTNRMFGIPGEQWIHFHAPRTISVELTPCGGDGKPLHDAIVKTIEYPSAPETVTVEVDLDQYLSIPSKK